MYVKRLVSQTRLNPASLMPFSKKFGVFHAVVDYFLEAFHCRDSLKTAHADAAEAPVLVPTKVYWNLSVR